VPFIQTLLLSPPVRCIPLRYPVRLYCIGRLLNLPLTILTSKLHVHVILGSVVQFQHLLHAQPHAIQQCVSASCQATPHAQHCKQRSVFQAVQVMTKICAESERSLDYYGLFKQIMKRAPVPMSPLESLASSAVRTAHKVCCLHCCAQCLQCMLHPLLCALPTRCAAQTDAC